MPSAITIAALAASIWLLGNAATTLSIGTAYPIWVGIGAVGTALGGVLLLGEPVSVPRLLLLALLVASIVGLKLTAAR